MDLNAVLKKAIVRLSSKTNDLMEFWHFHFYISSGKVHYFDSNIIQKERHCGVFKWTGARRQKKMFTSNVIKALNVYAEH